MNTTQRVRLEDLVPLWNDRLHPVIVRVAASEEERRQSYRLRCQAVVNSGWAPAESFPDGIETDEYDAIAMHVGAWLDGSLLASSRIVFPATDLILPTEAAFQLRVDPPGQVMDFGRTVVSRGLGQKGRDVLIGILLFGWQEMRKAGLRYCCGALSPAVLRIYRQLSVEPELLGEAQVHMGASRYPILCDLQDEDGRLAAKIERRLKA